MSRPDESQLVEIYECLGDMTRLRILNLLMRSPLCVCHLEQIIGGPQARMSRHLAYLKRHNIVTTRRYRNWNIYQIPAAVSPVVDRQLKCLESCLSDFPTFQRDHEHLASLGSELQWIRDLISDQKGSRRSRSVTCT